MRKRKESNTSDRKTGSSASTDPVYRICCESRTPVWYIGRRRGIEHSSRSSHKQVQLPNKVSLPATHLLLYYGTLTQFTSNIPLRFPGFVSKPRTQRLQYLLIKEYSLNHIRGFLLYFKGIGLSGEAEIRISRLALLQAWKDMGVSEN